MQSKLVYKMMLDKEMIGKKIKIPTWLLQNLYLPEANSYGNKMVSSVGYLAVHADSTNANEEKYIEQIIYWTFKNKPEALFEHLQVLTTMTVTAFTTGTSCLQYILDVTELEKEKYGYMPDFNYLEKIKKLFDEKEQKAKKTIAAQTDNFKGIILTLGEEFNMPAEYLEGMKLKDLIITYITAAKIDSFVIPDDWNNDKANLSTEQLKLLKGKIPSKVFKLVENIQKNKDMIPELQKEKKNVPTISKKYEELILTRKNEVEKTLATKTKEFKKIILTLGKKVNMPPEHLEGKTLRDLVVTYASVAKLTSCVLPDNWGIEDVNLNAKHLETLKGKLPSKIFKLVESIQKNTYIFKELKNDADNIPAVLERYTTVLDMWESTQKQRAILEKYAKLANKINSFCGQEMGISVKNMPTKIAASACLNITEAACNTLGVECNKILHRVPNLFPNTTQYNPVVLVGKEQQDMPFEVTQFEGDQLYDYVISKWERGEKIHPLKKFQHFSVYLVSKFTSLFTGKYNEPHIYIDRFSSTKTQSTNTQDSTAEPLKPEETQIPNKTLHKTKTTAKTPYVSKFSAKTDVGVLSVSDALYTLDAEDSDLSLKEGKSTVVIGIITEKPTDMPDPTKVFHYPVVEEVVDIVDTPTAAPMAPSDHIDESNDLENHSSVEKDVLVDVDGK